MAQVSGVRPPRAAADGSEGRRASAWREMMIAGICALAGTVVIAIAMRRVQLPVLFVIGAVALAFGATRFFHGLWRYVRD